MMPRVVSEEGYLSIAVSTSKWDIQVYVDDQRILQSILKEY